MCEISRPSGSCSRHWTRRMAQGVAIRGYMLHHSLYLFTLDVAVGHTTWVAFWACPLRNLLESDSLGLIDLTMLCTQLFRALAILALTATPHIRKVHIAGQGFSKSKFSISTSWMLLQWPRLELDLKYPSGTRSCQNVFNMYFNLTHLTYDEFPAFILQLWPTGFLNSSPGLYICIGMEKRESP